MTDQSKPEPVLMQHRKEQLEGLEGLDRALRRGGLLIELGADAGEEEETRLSDVLADLMHWANYKHVDFYAAVAEAWESRLTELDEWDTALVRIENAYEDGHTSATEVWVNAPKDDSEDEVDAFWEDVFEHTGDGHALGRRMDSSAEAEVTEGPKWLVGYEYSWEG